MKYPDDMHAVSARHAEDDHVGAAVLLAVAGHDIPEVPTGGAAVGKRGTRVAEPGNVLLGLIDAPVGSRKFPDVVDVGARPRRQDKPRHSAACSPRFRARKASKSNGSAAPLASPSAIAARSAETFISCASSSRRPARTTSLAEPYRPSFTRAATKRVDRKRTRLNSH